MSIRAQTLKNFAKSQFWGFKAFRAHGAHGALGPAATHPPGTTTETDTVTRAAPTANAPRDRIRRAGRFTPLTLTYSDQGPGEPWVAGAHLVRPGILNIHPWGAWGAPWNSQKSTLGTNEEAFL